ncbi:C45 family autoproteolytic acyltransferase/hydolase [Tenuibacillus multivorans]|uniref:Predicted choloylglycine hydrolase n=1 Tax=Tenuibacillus multivorans TaxID=237069 RepID=A0A1H0AYN8_9BACI|nr:C45 family autoproteolytic acyltransferase/hydolase [Tenuibacillus multivorans]GEL77610.1 choloylglycine hydrolase [Tenuibacillus multivorans]SDN38528.1 Predicted choloylglycine hydrolase [Tenuibacillus multivorans]
MKQIYSDVIQFRGTHYDFGFALGKRLRDSLTVKNRQQGWQLKRPRFEIDVGEAEKQFRRFAPAIWDELLGLRNGLQLPMEEVLRDFGGYRVEPDKSGCSIFTTPDFMVRNYDFHPFTYDGMFSLFQPTDDGYAFIGPTSRITGRMDGMNEKGLVMGYNFTHRKKTRDGFVCYMVGRMILEKCANVDEAIELVQSVPHRGAFSYNVMDINGKTYVIEAGPRAVEVRESNICTNHFEILTEENRRYLKDSYKRMNIIEENRQNMLDANQAFRFFNDTDKGVFAEQYKSWAGTIHTSLYLPNEKQVWFSLGGDQEPEIFDFNQWLVGEDVTIERMYGEVNTNLGFANIDKNLR